MVEWRWDQGRVLYFQYDVLREIAKVLVKFDGKNINDDSVNKDLRTALENNVGLPFAPSNYKVNRNYSRVFQCAMLARHDGRSLFVSDICRQIATGVESVSCDEYFREIVQRFRFPFPAFQEYNTTDENIFPFCAIIKMLIAKYQLGEEPRLDLEMICRFIIGNNCTGLEDIDFYKTLKPTGYIATSDSMRQLREMVAFISQLSFIKVFNHSIYLDILDDSEIAYIKNAYLKPITTQRLSDPFEEFRQITHLVKISKSGPNDDVKRGNTLIINPSDIEFTEGKKSRVQHLKIERSPLLRKYYVSLHPEPICAACEEHMNMKYPWAGYMLDLHHLLPLASMIKISIMGTSLDDIVGLCPSCHRAIHSYYRKWLKSNNREDFNDKKEAMAVYIEAVKEIS